MMCYRCICPAHFLISATQVLLVVFGGSGGNNNVSMMMIIMSVDTKLHKLYIDIHKHCL